MPSLLPQDPDTGGMEGHNPNPGYLPLPHQGPHPLPHLLGRLVGEGNGQDLPGFDPLGQEVGDPVGQDLGLPAAGPGQNQKGAGTMLDRFPLLLIKFRQ